MTERLDPTTRMAVIVSSLAIAISSGDGGGVSGRARAQPPEPHTSRAGPAPRFALYFFGVRPPFSYTYEPQWIAIRALDPAQARVRIHEADVLAYEVHPAPSACIVLRVTRDIAAQLSAARAQLTEGAVLALLDGAPMYAAQEYVRWGAAALRHPVVHLDRLPQDSIEICGALGHIGGPEEAMRIDRPELRELFRTRGVLRELPR